jgi:hypothetical protein
LGFSIAAETKGSVLIDINFLMNDALKISNVLQTNNQGTYAIDDT